MLSKLGVDGASKIRVTIPFIIGWAMNLSGSLIRRQCYNILKSFFTFELAIRKNHKLITYGPYSFVRHPSYTGALLSSAGAFLCHITAGSWLTECSGWAVNIWIIWTMFAVIVTLSLVPRMKKEDSLLHKQFGKEWESWAERVPYRLFPGIY